MNRIRLTSAAIALASVACLAAYSGTSRPAGREPRYASISAPTGQPRTAHLELISLDSKPGHRQAVFKFENPTEDTIYFFGRSADEPEIWIHFRVGDEWHHGWHDWCGGMGTLGLAAGESITFPVSFESDAHDPREPTWLKAEAEQIANRLTSLARSPVLTAHVARLFERDYKPIADHGLPIRIFFEFYRTLDDWPNEVSSESIEF